MDILTRAELRTLISKPVEAGVSIYLPTHRAGREIEQGPILLKNLLKKANEKLHTYGLRTPKIQTLLNPAESLLGDKLFWQDQIDGLALFLSPAGLRSYRLPNRFDPLVVVGKNFHIKPLFPLITADGKFYVLAISKNRVRLLQCSRYTVSESNLGNVPTSLAQALRYDDPEKHLQFHTGTSMPSAGGDRAALFHGHAADDDDAKSNLLRYSQKVNRGLHRLLKDEQVPLVLAGVKYLLAIYRAVNSYPYLVDVGIEGNPDEHSPEVLQQLAWEIVHPIFAQELENAQMQYLRLSNVNSERVSDVLREILPAAAGGRVETLFVAIGVHQWGTYNRKTNTTQLHEEAKPRDVDLLDLAAAQIFLGQGTVYAMKPEDVPGGSSIAAIFRY